MRNITRLNPRLGNCFTAGHSRLLSYLCSNYSIQVVKNDTVVFILLTPHQSIVPFSPRAGALKRERLTASPHRCRLDHDPCAGSWPCRTPLACSIPQKTSSPKDNINAAHFLQPPASSLLFLRPLFVIVVVRNFARLQQECYNRNDLIRQHLSISF